ncbi:MAG: hypothetical protein CMG24_02525 [Candidatus Marinimicrobia bacterium]|nr:hypothetical protein [Candidatus Neomarinimicrobiota bacterium]
MDKKELKQDLIRDRIIDSIQYISDQWQYAVALLLFAAAGISAFSFLSNKESDRFNIASEMSGVAQNEYNQGDIEFAIEDLEVVLGDYEDTHGGAQAYIYLIYDAYINSDDSKLESLLEDYSIYSSDPLLESSVLETKAYLSLNSGDYSNAIDLLNKSLKINNMDVLKVRFEIAKARVYIDSKEYGKAESILSSLKDEGLSNAAQRNTVDELSSYLSHINK